MTTGGEIIATARNLLDDTVQPYLWSDDDLILYLNQSMRELCRRALILKDTTNVDICKVTVTKSTYAYAVDNRVIRIIRAKLTSQTTPIVIKKVSWMDANVSDWENADDDKPKILIDDIDTNKVRLYPPPDADDTLWFHVFRYPVAEVTAATLGDAIETAPDVNDGLPDGIMKRAYAKLDSQTLNPQKEAEHSAKWEAHIADIKNRRRVEMSRLRTVNPLQGCM